MQNGIHLQNGILLLLLVNFGYIALLPRKFFKQKAKLSAQFWITAAPLFACPAFLALGYFRPDILPPLVNLDEPLWNFVSLIGVAISTLSILELGLAIATHRVPIHMFHDKEDQRVSHLVTWGPYKYVRHPIYSSYVLALFASVLGCPQIGTIACFIYGLISLSTTAAKEEKRLSSPEAFGEEYVQYMKHTGRFLPPLSAFSLSADQDSKAAESAPQNRESSSVGK